MIKIQQCAEPNILMTSGAQATQANRALVVADLPNFTTGKNKLNFSSSIYGHKSVKKALVDAQHEKCCFCESKVTHIAYGDVEHFRPKAGWRRVKSSKLERPGYFWLAYDWNNFLFCCEICNQREKRNHFPLESEQDRCVFPKEDVSAEKPLFINPRLEDPEQHIGFRGDTPYPINGSRKGRVTIDGLGLRRKALQSKRLSSLQKLKYVFLVANGTIAATPALQSSARLLLKRCARSKAEYSSAVRCAIKDGFQYV
ncbi:hypothetical protein [Prosthecobacter sp.]|uniref:hypothetical protein n=1 Tax=Prosthecobacter sp. TaxID=1965333 RepID=UPI003784B3C8